MKNNRKFNVFWDYQSINQIYKQLMNSREYDLKQIILKYCRNYRFDSNNR